MKISRTKRQLVVNADISQSYNFSGLAYQNSNFQQLVDTYNTTDYAELERYAWEKLMSGLYVTLKNNNTDMTVLLSPDVPENINEVSSIEDFMVDRSNTDELSLILNGADTVIGALTINPNEVTSEKSDYMDKLGDGVIDEYNSSGYSFGTLTYTVSDEAIVFYLDDDVVFIQPTNQIIPNAADLNDDIIELYESVISDILPVF